MSSNFSAFGTGEIPVLKKGEWWQRSEEKRRQKEGIASQMPFKILKEEEKNS